MSPYSHQERFFGLRKVSGRIKKQRKRETKHTTNIKTMKTFVKSIVFATVAISAVAWTGCSKKSEEIVVTDEQFVEILPVAGSSEGGVVAHSAVPSRAVINAGHDQDLQVAFARIDQKSETDATYPAYSGTVGSDVRLLSATWEKTLATADADATKIIFDAPQYYLTRTVNNNTKLVGWYPHLEGVNTFTNSFSAGVVSIAVDGANDIMLTQELAGNKNTDADKFGAAGKIFNFKHLLALLKFSVYAEDDAAKAVYGKLVGITLKSQLATCAITLPGDQASDINFTFASAPDPVDMAMVQKKADKTDAAITFPLELGVKTVTDNGDGTSTTAKNEKECGYALIAPVAASNKVTIAIETELGGTKEVDIEFKDNTGASVGIGAGYFSTVTLCFTASGIEPTATITEWVDGGNVDLVL